LDAITIELARRGDAGAVARLLRALQDPIFRFCMSLLNGDVDRASDASQETALRLLRDLPKFRGESRVQTWALGIALNVTREMKRSVKYAESLSPETREVASRTDSPAETSDLNEQRAIVRDLLADLPERQREAIVLRFFEDQSIEETAGLMNCAKGTVKATVHQAIRTLRMKLSPTTRN